MYTVAYNQQILLELWLSPHPPTTKHNERKSYVNLLYEMNQVETSICQCYPVSHKEGMLANYSDSESDSNQIKSNQGLFIVGITYNDISLYNIIHLNNK